MFLNGLFLFFVLIVSSGESRLNQGRGLVHRKLVKAPYPVILLLAAQDGSFRLGPFGDFRCGVSLFLIYINIKIGKNRCYVWEIAVHLAVACDALMASFCAVLFPTRCLGMRSGT